MAVNLAEEPVALLHGVGSFIILVVTAAVRHFGLHVSVQDQYQLGLVLLALYNMGMSWLSRSKVKPLVTVEKETQDFLAELDQLKGKSSNA